MSNETQTEDADSQEGVVLANQNLPGLGFLVNYAIYDGSVDLKDFVQAIYETSDIHLDAVEDIAEEGYGENEERKAAFQNRYQRLIPVPRHGGSAFSQAVRSLATKAKRVVHDDPDNVLTNNPERLRVNRNGSWATQFNGTFCPYAVTRSMSYKEAAEAILMGNPDNK